MKIREISHALITAGFFLYGASVGAQQTNFSEMSDVEVLLHEDREAGLAEFRRRASDYSPAEIGRIEREVHERLMTPRASSTPTPATLLGNINHAKDSLNRMEYFDKLHALYAAGDESSKAAIRQAFLEAWDDVTYPATYDASKIHELLLYREYAEEAGRYFSTEDTLFPILIERCLNIDAEDRHDLFIGAILNARIELGSIAAHWAEQIYGETISAIQGPLFNRGEADLQSKLLRIMGQSGKPGFDALIRVGKEDSEDGIRALGMNNTPESEELLWELYGTKNPNQEQIRLNILRSLSGMGGSPEERETRNARIRSELSQYLKLPEGIVNLWNVHHAISLAKDTKDPYFLPLISELRGSLSNLEPSEYECPGMEGRMDEALNALHKTLNDAQHTLERELASQSPPRS